MSSLLLHGIAIIPGYASKHLGHGALSSLSDAYSHKWLGSGFASPGLRSTGCSDDEVSHCWLLRGPTSAQPGRGAQGHMHMCISSMGSRCIGLQASLTHPCVQPLLTLPSSQCNFIVPSFLQNHCLEIAHGCLPTPGVQLCIIVVLPQQRMHQPDIAQRVLYGAYILLTARSQQSLPIIRAVHGLQGRSSALVAST